jgi:hypothetical protein
MIEDFYTTTFDQYRQAWKKDLSGNDYSELTEIDELTGHLQQMGSDTAVNLGLSLTKSFIFWCDPNTDIEENDVLKNGNDEYTVSAIKDLSIISAENKHLQVYLQKQ